MQVDKQNVSDIGYMEGGFFRACWRGHVWKQKSASWQARFKFQQVMSGFKGGYCCDSDHPLPPHF